MLRVLLVSVCLFPFVLKSQTIKMDNSIALSSFSSKKFDILNTPVKSYSFMIGIDYLNSGIIGLSSQVGFLTKGGEEEITIPYSERLIEKVNYMHFNTTLRLRHEIMKCTVYAGIGPKVDVLIDKKYLQDFLYKDYKLNRISAGVKYELGFDQSLTDKISVGINVSYIQNIGIMGGTEYNELTNNTFLFSFVLGCKL